MSKCWRAQINCDGESQILKLILSTLYNDKNEKDPLKTTISHQHCHTIFKNQIVFIITMKYVFNYLCFYVLMGNFRT